jgi:hypothetical protein
MLLPFRRRSVFRFKSTLASDGKVYWLRLPMTADAEQDLSRFEDPKRTTVHTGGGVVNAPPPNTDHHQ